MDSCLYVVKFGLSDTFLQKPFLLGNLENSKNFCQKQKVCTFDYLGRELTIRLVTANGALQKEDINLFFRNFPETTTNVENKQDWKEVPHEQF